MIEHRINEETGRYEVKKSGQTISVEGERWLALFGDDEPTLDAAIEIILSQRGQCRHVRRKTRSSNTGRSRVDPWVFRSHMTALAADERSRTVK